MKTRSDKVNTESPSLFDLFRRAPRRLMALLSGVSVAALQVLPAYGDVLAVAGTGTTINSTGTVTDVTTSTVQNGIGFNRFSEFNVDAGLTVNLYQPATATTALVNIIESDAGISTIDGTVNARIGIPGLFRPGGNTYLVNSAGFVVSASGVINAGSLTISTPTDAFVNALIAQSEGSSGLGALPSEALFAGQEPLSADGQIDIQGHISATRLDMRAGARLIVDGRLDIEGGSSGPLNPSVNIDGVPTAGSVNIGRDGVIRLVSGGSARVSGNVAARGSILTNRYGGLIEIIAAGELRAGGRFDVSYGTGPAGSVMMFTTGSAILEPALNITAGSTAGAGGFVAIRANEAITVDNTTDDGLMIDTSGNGGEAFLVADAVTLSRDLFTRGGSLGISGASTVTIGRDGGAVTLSSERADGAAGDIIITAPEIDVTPDTVITARGTGAGNGGLVALVARNVSSGIVWAINPDAQKAKVTITDSTIAGGSVVVTAVAKATNIFGDPDETVEATQVDEMEGATTEEEFNQIFTETLATFELVAARGITAVNDLIPVQIQVLTADARVEITNSTLTADGNWTAITASETDAATEFATNGYLSAAGLREDTYRFLAPASILDSTFFDDAYQLNIKLPSGVDLENDSLIVHSHAATEVDISPVVYGLGLAVTHMQTVSSVKVLDSDLLTNAGNIRLAATASENQTVNIQAKKLPGVAGAVGVVVSVRDLRNQLLVDGGSLVSADSVLAGAFAGRDLSSTVVANSGMEGIVAIGVNLDFSNSLSEAAIGGTVTAQTGNITIDAEQLFFNLSRSNSATMGVGNLAKAATRHRTSSTGATGFAQTLQQTATGKTPDPDRKPHFAMGVAVDIQINDDNAFATLGGSYHDIDDTKVAPVALGTTVATATGNTVAVNAAYRFADRGGEGGGVLTRATSAAFGKLTLALKRELDRFNARNPSSPITEDELLGRFSNALMLNVSVASMIGEARAEIGPSATVNAASLDLNAVTRFPNTSPIGSLVNQWDNYVDQVTDYQPLTDTGAATPPEPTPPPAPDLAGFLDIVNPLTYLTTDSKAKGEAAVAGDRTVVPGEEQALALGVTLTYFNTDNQTQAVIRDGAVVTLQDAASVSALQESLFLHATNLPKKNPLGGTAKVDDAIGGGIHFGRTVSTVLAEIESGATVTVASGDLDVTADTRNIAVSLAYSGGQGSDVAINASIAAQVSDAQTMARIGEAARITARDVKIAATDSSVTWNTAGAISGSDVVGVGASGVFNFTSRKLYAGIGPRGSAAPSAAATGDVVTANSLTILAENKAVDVTVAVAGTKVVGKPDPAPETEPPANTEDDDMIIPTWLFSDEEEDAANAQQDVDTPEDSQGQQQKSGWAVSGAAAVNLALQNETTAEIRTRGRIMLDTSTADQGSLSLTARSTATMVNVTGAVSAGLGSDKDTNALAGAFSVHVDERNLRSRIDSAQVTAGQVTMLADDQATLANIAVGGAGTSRGDLALAGSVSFAILSGETLTEIRNAGVTSQSLSMKADDTSTTVSVGGAVGINMDATQGYGVGVGIAVNTVLRSATARITGSGAITTGILSVASFSQQSVYGFAISAGVGKTGLAGSVAVNTISGGARSLVDGTESDKRRIKADELFQEATERNTIFALAGALAGGRSTAVGASVAVNTIVAGTETRLEDVILASRDGGPALGQVSLTAQSDSVITAISVAGAAALSEQAAGIGLSVNTINANAITSLARSEITDAVAVLATANGERIIRSLAGGVAAAGRGAAGAGLTLNLLPANITKVILDDAKLTTRNAGAITATATAAGEIASAAVGISGSSETAIGGALTVNVTTAETAVTATNAVLDAAGALVLTATDTATIGSLSGGAAISLGGNGVGGAVSANFIAHDTHVLANNGSLTGTGITLSSTNTSGIKAAAVGLAATATNAFAGSVAIGDIGNTTRTQAAGTILDARTGAISATARRGGSIDILSGSAAFGGTNAVGAALSVAVIHGGATADIVTDQPVIGAGLDMQATDTASVDAIAVSGAAGAGGSGGAGSLVYTQIGQVAVDGPSVHPLPGGVAGEDPLAGAQASVRAARDSAINDLAANLTGRAGVTLDAGDVALSLESEDTIRTRLELTGLATFTPSLSLATTQTGTTRSLAGAAGFGSNAGIGAGFALNLLFGKAEAELILPAGEVVTTTGPVAISTTQTGTVETAGVAGGGAGAVGGAGSMTINVMNRQADARIASATPGMQATLLTQGRALDLGVVQTGTINSIAGAAGIGGSSGFGGAITVNVVSDDAAVTLNDVILDTRNGLDLRDAAAVTLTSDQVMDLSAAAAALAGSGGGSFAGSFAVNVADGNVGTTVGNSEILASTITATSNATPGLTGNAGAVALGSTGAVGIAVVTNIGRQVVRTDIDASEMRAEGAITLGTGVEGTLTGNAISGAADAIAGISGTGVGNSALNTAELLIRDSGTPATGVAEGGSDIVTAGSVLMTARASNAITLRGGSEEEPGVNVSFSGGGAAGIGASATVNTLGNTARVVITGNSRVVGLGQTSVMDNGTARYGVAADAATSATIAMLTANGAVGGVAGVAALFSINLINDDARVILGTDGSNAILRINGDVSELASVLGSTDAGAQQDARLTAQSSASATVLTANVAVGGKAGVGAGSGNLISRAVAAVDVTGAQISAARDIVLSAEAVTDLTAVTFGLAGGFVGVAANAGVSVLAAQALVDVDASDLAAGRDLTLSSRIVSDSIAVTGAAAGGAVGGAGGVQVTVFESTSRVSQGRNIAAADSNLSAQRNIDLSAKSDLTLDGKAVSGAFGGVGISLALNVGIVKATTLVDIGVAETLVAQHSLSLLAKDTVSITGMSGSLGAGGLGLGASFDYASFRGNTRVSVGDDSLLVVDPGTTRLANPSTSARNLTLEALSERRITSAVVAIGAGSIAINAALGIVDMGGRATDADKNRDTLLADAQGELAADLKGDTGDLDETETRNTAGALMAYAGADATRGQVADARQAIVLNGAVTPDSVTVLLGDSVTLNTRGNVTLRADVATSVNQTAGGLSASVFGGATSGNAVSNIATSVGVQVGSGSSIRADGIVSLSALGRALDANSLLEAKSFTLAASLGYSVGVGVAVASVNATSAVNLGSGIAIGGYLGQSASMIDLSAKRFGTISTDVVNASLSVAGGAGLVVSDATIAGGTAIRVGGEREVLSSRMVANKVFLATDDTSRATASGEGSSGGIARASIPLS